MFQCHACLRRTLRALVDDIHPQWSSHLPSPTQRLRRFSVRYLSQTPSTGASSAVAHSERETRDSSSKYYGVNYPEGYKAFFNDSFQKEQRGTWDPKERKQNDRIRTQQRTLHSSYARNKAQGATKDGSITTGPQASKVVALSGDQKDAQVRRELQFLPDPLRLAGRVKAALQKGDEEKAVLLTQKASKMMSCTVSWNHLIDYQMSKGHVVPAMKTYNDVRRRACISYFANADSIPCR